VTLAGPYLRRALFARTPT